MLCPRCNSSQLYAVDSRPYGNFTRRRKECMDCKVRFNTLEITELEYKDLKGKEAILKSITGGEKVDNKRSQRVSKPHR